MTAVDSSNPAAMSGGASFASGTQAKADKLPIVVILFVLALLTPIIFNLGPIRLSAYRVLLLIAFFPSIFVLFSKKVGKVRTPDICVMVICFWASLSLVYHNGLSEMVEPIGIFWIEMLGAYMIGRCFLRTPAAFEKTVRLLFWLCIITLPFAVFEAVTGNNVILKFFDALGQSYADVYKDRRLGLDRVQGMFAHPIHFGVFFGALVGVTYYVLGYGKPWIVRVFMTLLVAGCGALALSSGPLAALVAQVYFILWDGVFRAIKSRWYILIALSLLAYVLIDFLSNRTPFVVLIHYLAFNAHTAYNRLLIWEWGTKNIFDNPIFGIGYNDWERLSWMTGSFDMFWLLHPMQHGIPVWIAYNVMFFWLFIKIAFVKIPDPRISAYRVGYLATMFGLFMSGWTVHYWDATFVFFMFLMSSGFWFLDMDYSDNPDAKDQQAINQRKVRYSRFQHEVEGDEERRG